MLSLVLHGFSGHVNRGVQFLSLLSHIVLSLHRTALPHGLSLYWAVSARVKGRAHSMLRKCFIWILDRELCFHIMNEHFFIIIIIIFFDISVLKSIWNNVGRSLAHSSSLLAGNGGVCGSYYESSTAEIR